MQQGNLYKNYHNTHVQTADQRKLIIMLFDGMIRFLNKGKIDISARDFENAHQNIQRARDIVSELLATLRPEKAGDLGENLKRLYTYSFNRLVEANLKKDTEMIDEVIHIMSNIREGWKMMKPEVKKNPFGKKVNVTL